MNQTLSLELTKIEEKLEILLREAPKRDAIDKLRCDLVQLKKTFGTELKMCHEEQGKMKSLLAEQNSKISQLTSLLSDVLNAKNRYSLLRGGPLDAKIEIKLKEAMLPSKNGLSTSVAKLNPHRLLQDLSRDLEPFMIPVINEIDSEEFCMDFHYVTSLVRPHEFPPIDSRIGSLYRCDCKDDCASSNCACVHRSLQAGVPPPVYSPAGTLDMCFETSDNGPVHECTLACACRARCRNRVVQHGICRKLEIFKTPKCGWGLRAGENIPAGAFICEYIGEILSPEEGEKRENDSYLFEIEHTVGGSSACIDGQRFGNVGRFINHSCVPNLVPISVLWDHAHPSFPHIAFFSFQPIPKGAQLTFDYGEKFWVVKSKDFTCTCGSADCLYNEANIDSFLEAYCDQHFPKPKST